MGLFSFALPPWSKYAAVGFVILAIMLGTWRFTANYKDAVWQSKFDAYKLELAELHQKNLNEVLQKERQAQERANEIEVKYHATTDQIRTLRNTNARLANELGGMRDPGKTDTAAGMGVSQGAASGNTVNAASQGQLSREASRFLLDFAEDADRAAAYANACYEWVNREKLKTLQVPEPAKP